MMLIVSSIILGLLAFLLHAYFKHSCVKCESNLCLVGKTALVTGGSSGIGYHIVSSLASRGCRVIIADKVVTDEVKKAIINETDNSNIVLEYVDFASFKSVRQFAEKIKNSEEKLDILINNVGIGKCDDNPTENGLNLTMQINYYSPFLLTHLLVDLLRKSDDARIVFTSSFLSFFNLMVPFEVTSNTIKNKGYRAFDYILSKFCTVVASDIFAKRLRNYNIKSNCYHPGGVKTNIFKQATGYYSYFDVFDILGFILGKIILLLGQLPENASQTAVNMVVSKDFKSVTGTFFGVILPNYKPKGCEDKALCEKIWNASEYIVQLKPNEKLKV